MKRRDFLAAAGSAVASSWWVGGGCSRRPRLSDKTLALRDLMAGRVTQGQLPGAVWLVSRRDDVAVDALGMTAIDGSTPMRRDTIFRIASMTKPITATAVMILVEEGKLELDAPVERWLPELADRRVLRRLDGPITDTVPARRPIAVRDLLTFTLGFGMLFDNTLPIQRAIDERKLVNGPPVPMTPHAPDEWMRLLGQLPLMHQPGERWMYNTGSLLQGVLVGRASGRPFDAFVRERIFTPLGMRDTDFFVPAAKLPRFAGCGVFTDPQSGAKVRMDKDGAASAYASPPVFPSGAGGLLSTVDDFWIFARMLLSGGVHRGQRLLSAESVRDMTVDHLTPQQKAASTFFPGFFDTNGWGYGVAVSPGAGRYWWDGGFGTSWFNDPGRDLVAIVLTQSSDFLFTGGRDAFFKGAYQAVA